MPRSHVKADCQFAALPLRETDGKLELLMITSRETRRWVLPKGWAEEGLTGAELARKEAFEEAGIVGRMNQAAIGSYRYTKRLADGSQVWCKVTVFRMSVEQELEDWPERGERQRQWFNVEDAAMLVAEEGLADLLRRPVRPG